MPDTHSKLQHPERERASSYPRPGPAPAAQGRPDLDIPVRWDRRCCTMQLSIYKHTALLHKRAPALKACVCMQERLTISRPKLVQHTAAHGMPAGLQDPDTPVEDDAYADRRWREIKLQPHGHRFTEKVQQLFSSAELGAGEF